MKRPAELPTASKRGLSAREVTALLEQKPFEIHLWNDLAECTRTQNDLMSALSIDAIANGLSELKRKNEASGTGAPSVSNPSNFATSIFIRLARSYNNPNLLKQAGMLFFSEWHLPSAALELFERSIRLGATEKEIRPLREAASIAIEQQVMAKEAKGTGYSGITTVQHVQPVIEELLVKSGPLLVPWSLQGSPAPHPSSFEDLEDDDPLPETTQECIAKALVAVRQLRFRKAETLLLKANIRPAPEKEMYEAWSSIGNAAFEANLYAEMETAYQHAFSFNPSALGSHFNLALAHHLNKDFAKAELKYLSASHIDPSHPKTWCNLGVLYFQNKDYPRAEVALQRAVAIDPTYARAWDNLASVLGSQNKLAPSLDACLRAIQVRPDFPEAHFKIGLIHFGNHDLKEAGIAFEHAARLPQLAPFAFTYLAMVRARMGEIEAAESFIRKASEIEPRGEMLGLAWSDIGKAYYLKGNFSAAISVFEEVALLQVDAAEAWFHLGLCAQGLGEFERAEGFYQHAVDLDPNFHAAWHNLGILYAAEERHSDASHAFRMELRGRPDHALAWNDLALSLVREGLADEAVAAFAQADMYARRPLKT